MSHYTNQVAKFHELLPYVFPLQEPEGPPPPIQEKDHDLSKIDHWGSMCVVLGWGDGSLFRSMLRKATPRIQKKQIIWVIFEAERENFVHSLKNKIQPDYDCGLIVGMFMAKDEFDAREVSHRLTSSHTAIPLLGSLNIYCDHKLNPEAEKIRNRFRPAIRRQLEEKLALPGNSPDDAWDGVRNSILNLPKLIDKPSSDVLDNVLQNAPVICVGSGPHLEGYIDDLRAIQNNAYIICAESAMGSLLDEDIVPDLCCPMERPESTEKWCRPAAESDVWYGGISVVPPGALEHFGDRLLLIPGSDKIVDWYDPARELSRMWTGHTTCVLGLSVARWLSLGDIYLVGQDLAFGETGKSHWSAVADYKPADREYYNGEPAHLPGNSGNKVRSTKIWSTVITQISEINRQCVQTLGLPPIKSVMAHDKVGAVVPGLAAAPFPKDLPALNKINFRDLPKNPSRKAYWTQCLNMLPYDWKRAIDYFTRLFNVAVRVGADHVTTWERELHELAQSTSVYGGVTPYNRPITRYVLHNMLYHGALNIQVRRNVQSDYRAKFQIADCMRAMLHDFITLMTNYLPYVEDTCRKAKTML